MTEKVKKIAQVVRFRRTEKGIQEYGVMVGDGSDAHIIVDRNGKVVTAIWNYFPLEHLGLIWLELPDDRPNNL